MDRILFIDNTKIFKKWASKTYEYKINTIRENPKFVFVDIDDIDSVNANDFETVIFGWNATYISKFYTTKYNFYRKYIENLEFEHQMKEKLKDFLKIENKFLIVQDLFDADYYKGVENLCKYLKRYKFNGIVTPYYKIQSIDFVLERIPELDIIHVPHHIDSNNFKDYGLKKKYDIFLFGNTSTVYMFRARIKDLLQKNKDKFNVVIWDKYRNYFKHEAHKSNDRLSRVINQSWLTICTPSNYDMLLGKYFETSMSNSTVCGNMPEDGKNIWRDNYIELNPEMSDEEIINSLERALKYKSVLIKKSKTMMYKMKKYHLNKFSNKLYNMII